MHPSWQHAVKQSLVYKKLADKYQSPRGYTPWNDMLQKFGLAGDPQHLRHITNHLGIDKDTANIIQCGVGAVCAATLDAPAIYVDSALMEAILCTEVSAMEPPKLVLPSFFICLPFNTLFDDEGDAITGLLVVVHKIYLPFVLGMSNTSTDRKFTALQQELTDQNANNLHVFAYTAQNAVISITHGWDVSTVATDDTSPIMYSPLLEHPLDEQAFRGMSSAIMRIVKNVILIYNYQKDCIGELPVKVSGLGFAKRKKHNKRDPLPVTLLGKNFIIRKESARTQPRPAQGGTVRPHWRKGHWHTVLTGAGRRERKFRWFQPVYVNLAIDT
jgi:hypothetical protein